MKAMTQTTLDSGTSQKGYDYSDITSAIREYLDSWTKLGKLNRKIRKFEKYATI